MCEQFYNRNEISVFEIISLNFSWWWYRIWREDVNKRNLQFSSVRETFLSILMNLQKPCKLWFKLLSLVLSVFRPLKKGNAFIYEVYIYPSKAFGSVRSANRLLSIAKRFKSSIAIGDSCNNPKTPSDALRFKDDSSNFTGLRTPVGKCYVLTCSPKFTTDLLHCD